MEIKILKTCANCKYAIETECNKYYCPIQNYEVKWCGTCSKHKLIENKNVKYLGIAYNHKEEIFYSFMENNFEIIKEKTDMYFDEGCSVEIYRCCEETRVCIYRKDKK